MKAYWGIIKAILGLFALWISWGIFIDWLEDWLKKREKKERG